MSRICIAHTDDGMRSSDIHTYRYKLWQSHLSCTARHLLGFFSGGTKIFPRSFVNLQLGRPCCGVLYTQNTLVTGVFSPHDARVLCAFLPLPLSHLPALVRSLAPAPRQAARTKTLSPRTLILAHTSISEPLGTTYNKQVAEPLRAGGCGRRARSHAARSHRAILANTGHHVKTSWWR